MGECEDERLVDVAEAMLDKVELESDVELEVGRANAWKEDVLVGSDESVSFRKRVRPRLCVEVELLESVELECGS